jgi:muramoyltetrapeptide carboxypeptidase
MRWHYLKEGDLVDVIAPGYPSHQHEIESARDFLNKWNLRSRIPRDIVKPHFLHSHEDEQRFLFLKNSIESKDSHVIWCLRGGYGSNRLLPFLSKMRKPKKPKLLIGISDITSLHTFFTQKWGWSTLHAPLLDRLGRGLIGSRFEKELNNLLFGRQDIIEFGKLRPLNNSAKTMQKVNCTIVGGNLTVLQSTLGTPWQIDCTKKILFIEDLGERGYRIDRMLEQFRQAGLFDRCQALILGDFLGGEEPQTKKNNFKLIFKRWANDLAIPVFKGLPAGHAKIQRPVPLNTTCYLWQEGGFGKLKIDSGGEHR